MNKPNTTTRLNVPGFFSWDAMDEECLREGAALKRCFHTTAIKGTPKRKTKLSGGPKNRKLRANLAKLAD